MRYLYVDNFRGFQDTYIPIKDVNFFVGENSTGKTSILGLLKLLSSTTFWFNQEFNTEEVSFSHFKDIVSANSGNKKSFTVGLIDVCSKDAKGEKEVDDIIRAYVMTFTQKDGMPFLKKYTYKLDDKEVHILFSNKTIKYKFSFIRDLACDNSFIKNTYKKWIEEHKRENKGYSLIPVKLGESILAVPLLIISSIVNDLVSDEKIKKDYRIRHLESSPFFNVDMAWLAPIRTKPKRTYDSYKSDYSPEGGHTPYLIKKILSKEANAKGFKKFIKEIGIKSGLFEGVAVKQFGRGATSPFELKVIINGKPLNVCSVGYGVSQSLPVLVELFARQKETWYAIQQPEVHLHPKAQAALGSVFYSLAITEGKKFFIETHSDYTIDRFRINYRKNKDIKKPVAQILYFEREKNGNKIHQLEIGTDGELPQDQPKCYREFFIKEEMDMLGI